MYRALYTCVFSALTLLFVSCSSQEQSTTNLSTTKVPGTTSSRLLTLAASSSAGSIPGHFEVDANGAANYQISLTLPPGTNGVTPDISLKYNSNQRNGLLGIGWTISGLHSISRCGRTIAQDGMPGAVSYQQTDRFCIDGQRLIAYKNAKGDLLPKPEDRAAAYGQDGTQYRTERETWSLITSSGRCGIGPCSFSTQMKDGTTAMFGSSSSSRVLALSRPEVRVWAQDKSTDRHGNYVTAIFAQENGSYRITSLAYTGNDRTGVSPQRLVVFNYEVRSDPIYANVGGSSITLNKKLSSISTYIDADPTDVSSAENLVSTYQIIYAISATTEDSIITEVKHCDAAGVCLPSTTFGYTEVEKGLNVGQVSPIPSSMVSYFAALTADIVPADIDGNGITDFSAFNRGLTTLPVLLGQPNGTFTDANLSIPDNLAQYFNGPSPTRYAGDFNGDGKFDIAVFGKSYTTMPILFSNGDGSFTASNKNMPAGFAALFNVDNASKFAGDFNGDGKTDFAVFKKGYAGVPVILSNGDGTFEGFNVSLSASDIALFTASDVQIVSGDVNGDGMSDFSAFKSGYATLPLLIADGKGSFTFINNDYPAGYQAFFTTTGTVVEKADFNSDGLIDFAAFRSGVNSQPVLFSLGNGYFSGANNDLPTNIQGKFAGDGVQRVSGDYNGDGLSDIAAFSQDWPTVPIMYSLGDGSFVSTNNALQPGYEQRVNGGAVQRQMGDFNGDGLFDLLVFQKSQTDVAILFTNQVSASQAHADLVETITTGAGALTRVAYLPITAETVYTPGTEALDYPMVSAKRALFVVSSHTTASHSGDQSPNVFNHYYQGAIFDWTRGWQGFRATSIEDTGLGHRTNMTYHMSFPLTGKVSTSEVTLIADTALTMAQQSITYGSKEAAGIYTIWAESVKSDHFTKGNYNYTLQNTYTYDPTHRNIIIDANMGDISDPDDDLITCINYYQQAGQPWWAGSFPAQNKQTSNVAGCDEWSQWVEGTDISWTQYQYNDVMDLTEQRSWWNTESTWKVISATYDDFGNVLSVIDANSAESKYSYDNQFHTFLVRQYSPPLSPQDSRQLVLKTSYDPRFAGVMTNLVDPNGNNTHNIPDGGLDGFGRVLEVKSVGPDDDTLHTVLMSSIENVTQGIKHTIRFQPSWEDSIPIDKWGWSESYYDGHGRNYRVESPGYTDEITLVTETLFDSAGRPVINYVPYYIDASQCIRYSPQDSCASDKLSMTNEYDAAGHLSLITAADGAKTAFNYSPTDDRIINKVSPSPAAPIGGTQTVTETIIHNALGLTVTDKDALGGITSFSYDRLRRLRSQTDAVNSTRTLTYDSLGNVVVDQSTETGSTTYSYTPTGLVSSIVDASSRTQSFSHDLLGRVTQRQLFLPSSTSPEQTDTYTYDEINIPNSLGRLSSIVMPGAEYRFRYDNTNQRYKQEVELTVGGASQADKFDALYAYDPMGRQLTIQSPDGDVTQYNYNQTGFINSVDLKKSGQAEFVKQSRYDNYNSYGNPGRLEYANGVVAQSSWYVTGGIKSRVVNKGAMTYVDDTYQRNDAQKILAIDDALPGGKGQTMLYDQLGQLISATGRYGTQSYEYNPAGDLTKKGSIGFQYDTSKPHQLVSACAVAAGTSDCGGDPALFAIEYDASGHEINRTYQDGSVRNYAFDGASNIVGITETNAQGQQQSSAYSYDTNGARLTKVDPLGTSSYYIFPEFDVLYTPAQSTNTARTVRTLYVSDTKGPLAAYSSGTNCPAAGPDADGLVPGCNGSGNPVAGSQLFFSDNEVRSVDLVTDANGAANSMAEVVYEPFGLVADVSDGVDDFRPKFTSKELDSNTGLYYFGARYYDPELGRFIGPDPAHQYTSPYIYGANDPFSGTDPDGQFFGVDDAVVVAVVAAAVGAYAGGSVANHSMNPVSWKWGSTSTWVGVFTGGAAGVAVAATGGAALAALGAVAPEAVAIGGMSAGTVATLSSDAAFVLYDANQFARDPSVTNGIFLSLDFVPFASMVGRGVKGATKTGEAFEEGASLGRNVERDTAATRDAEQTSSSIDAGPGCHSFTGNTLVKSDDGYIPVKDIKVGDLVWAYDEAKQVNTLSPVADIFRHEVKDLFEVQLPNGIIETTSSHLFYTDGQWVEAGQLKAGQLLHNGNNEEVPVITTRPVDRPGMVYNFEVQSTPSYYVSSNEVLVHNVKAACLVSKDKKRPSWQSGASKTRTRVAKYNKQIDKYGRVTSSVKRAGKKKLIFKLSHKIKIGSKGRLRTVWDIDHKIPYRFLLWAAQKSKKLITWKDMRIISNDVRNLRLMTMSENVGHAFEPSVSAGRAGAIKILKQNGFW